MAIDDQSRGKKTYGAFRTAPRIPPATTLVPGNNITITGDQNGLTISATSNSTQFSASASGVLQTTGSIYIQQSLAITGTIYTSGSVAFTMASGPVSSGTYSSNGPSTWGALSLYSRAMAPNIDMPQVGYQWNNGWLSGALQPHFALGAGRRQSWHACGVVGSAAGATLGFSPTFAGSTSGVAPSSPNRTGSYGQVTRKLFGTATSAQAMAGLNAINADDAVWVGTDSNTGGFYFNCKFSIEQFPRNNTGLGDVTGSFLCGYAEPSNTWSPSTGENWETYTAAAFFGIGFTARAAGNNVINKQASGGSYNWQAIAHGSDVGTNIGKAPQKTDTGIQIVVQHIMEVQLYMPPGVSSSVYWSLTDITTGQQSVGQFLASNNVLPVPLDTNSGMNYLNPGIQIALLTGSSVVGQGSLSGVGPCLGLISFYQEAPY